MHKEVLDIGCGVKKEGTVNVDVNSAVKPDIVCDGHSLPFKDESFDECILKHMLEHSVKPSRLISECSRILRRDGLLFVTFPNFASFTVLLEWLGKKPSYSEDLILGDRIAPMQSQWHKQLCTTTTVRALLARHGFNVRKVIGHSPNVGPRALRFLGSIVAKLFSERAGNVTMIAKKRYSSGD